MSARERIVAADKRRVWHPYTPMRQYVDETEPLCIARAQGSRLFDADGRAFLDGNSSWWTAALGHGHPRLVAALKRQADVMAHVPLAGITHEPAALLAEELIAVAPPGLSRVFYADDGSTAVEIALKLALQYWHQNGRPERTRFVALGDAFHGDTLGAAALGGVEVFRRPFAGVLLDCVHVPVEPSGHERAFAALERLLRTSADTLAAVVLEPVVQGAAGMRIYSPEHLARVAAVARDADVFLVLDEVFTGYGRTGPMWASQHAGVSPDLLCTAKALSGGLLPMGATLVSERIFEGFLGEPERAFYYGHTFSGNPLGAALAREVLAIYRDERILERAAQKALRIRSAFEQLATCEGVGRVRSLGMIGALELEGQSGYLAGSGRRVAEEALKRGAYLRPLGNVVYVAPPLNIDDADLDELLAIVDAAVRAAVG
ncbi:MAG: adenosylmethionine--8-amino-7-oxononanoate transaminase [Polyangiaceae bacterium]|nr:adenosylmethionine--8-amino-7-oxononanoate transaminase [Polyangiaceae bacterium]